METGKLFMQMQDDGSMKVVFEPVNGTVWLTANQTAQFLGCYPVKVTSNIKVIFKSEVLRESEVCRTYKYYVNSKTYPERQGVLYNLDVIIALAYRIKSRNSEVFRNWLIKRTCYRQPFVPVQLTDERKISLN
jgi:hypothetical protein